MLWLVPGPMGWLGYGLAECHLSSGGYRVVSRRVGGMEMVLETVLSCQGMNRHQGSDFMLKERCIGYNL